MTTATSEALALAKEIDDGWRAANGWPGMVWPDGPGPYRQPDRWPVALEDRIYRIALALTEQAREIERLTQYADELENRNRQLRARLGAYREYLIMRPFKLLAIQHADMPVEIPTPESLVDILDELDALRARAAAQRTP